MARIYRLGTASGPHGKIMSGVELIAHAQRVFKTNDTHGWGRSGKPTTVSKAVGLLGHISPKVYVYTRLETESKWVMA